MSGMLHPVGPEPARTYWVRRGVIVVALVLAIVLLVTLVRAIAGPSAPTTAAPAGSSPGPALTRAPVPASSPSATAGVSATSSPTATPTASSTPSPTRTAPVACASADLVSRIRGAGRAKSGKPVAFALGVVNRSDQTCVITIGPGNIELKIFSGTDRIWSTKDCRTLVRRQVQKAAPGQGVALMVTWNGRRSATGCKVRPEIPQPGTYFATVQLYGADPVQQRVIIS